MSQASNGKGNSNQIKAANRPRDERQHRLFRALDKDGDGAIRRSDIEAALQATGLRPNDMRLEPFRRAIAAIGRNDAIDIHRFSKAIAGSASLIEMAIQNRMAIPDFATFAGQMEALRDEVSKNTDGAVANNIPQLARVEPDQFGVAMCTVDGQRCAFGEASTNFSLQAMHAPLSYLLALDEHGADAVHGRVGRRTGRTALNTLALTEDGQPLHPMSDEGAILAGSMIRSNSNAADRFDYVVQTWRALAGGEEPGFSNSVYLSSREAGERSWALAHFMKERGAFADGVNVQQALEFFFQCSSVEISADNLSVIAGTLANGGICPVTGEQVVSADTVKHCLSMMFTTGMGDYSDESAFVIGLPAKSGVSGGMMVIVPNVMGIALWSPRIDAAGNSVRGIDFATKLVEKYNFHLFDSRNGASPRIDPTVATLANHIDSVSALTWAVHTGDLTTVQQLVARGASPEACDYDRRTPLHIAAAEGHLEIARFLLDKGAPVNPLDRWGGTPLDDAHRSKSDDIKLLLTERGGQSGSPKQKARPAPASNGEPAKAQKVAAPAG